MFGPENEIFDSLVEHIWEKKRRAFAKRIERNDKRL